MSLRVHLKQVELSCGACLRSWFTVPKKDVKTLGKLCSKRVPPLDRGREVALLRRRYNRVAQIIRILASSETSLDIIQPKIKLLKILAESLGACLNDCR